MKEVQIPGSQLQHDNYAASMIIFKKKNALILIRNQINMWVLSKILCLSTCLFESFNAKTHRRIFERLWYHQVSKANRCATDASLDRLTLFGSAEAHGSSLAID